MDRLLLHVKPNNILEPLHGQFMPRSRTIRTSTRMCSFSTCPCLLPTLLNWSHRVGIPVNKTPQFESSRVELSRYTPTEVNQFSSSCWWPPPNRITQELSCRFEIKVLGFTFVRFINSWCMYRSLTSATVVIIGEFFVHRFSSSGKAFHLRSYRRRWISPPRAQRKICR